MTVEHGQKITEKIEDAKMEDRQGGKNKRLRAKKLYFVACAFVLLCTLGSAFSVVEYQRYNALYHKDVSLAGEGLEHLRTGITLLAVLPRNPFDAPTVQNAQHEFGSALTIFVQLGTDLQSLPKISTSIPIYGARLSAASHLLPLAIEASQMGIVTCNTLDLLISRLHDPMNTQAQGLTMADFAVLEKNFRQIKTTLNLIIDQVNHLQPGNLQLDPRLSKLVASTINREATVGTLSGGQVSRFIVGWLDVVEKLLPIAPTLLGIDAPANYLIEVLDSTELRPGGGFIGNYGVVTLSGGRLTTAHITDVDLLDKPFEAAGHFIPFPPAYKWFQLVPSWSLRDSNLDADFPTAARYGEMNYMREGGNVPVQGVIAITPALIQQALEITGPIDVPEYHETVTALNLIARIHYHQLGPAGEGPDTVPSPDGHSSLRKRFTELLAEHFLSHVRQLPPSDLPKFLQLLANSLSSKDIQIYLNSTIAESLLQQFHLDAAIQPSVGDGLFIVDANIGGNKANGFMINMLNDQVSIDMAGNALHHTTISYAWTVPGTVYGGSVYQDYVRVYVPPGSKLQMQNGWQPQGTSHTFGHKVWAGLFSLVFGQTITITLVWTVPAAATKNASGWHYQYLIQRQAGAQWQLHLQVTLPCAAMNKKWEGLVPSNTQGATLIQSLKGDLNVASDYSC